MKPGNLLEQGIDVTKMGLESPENETEPRFDSERDITEEQWAAAKAELQRRAEKGFTHRGDWQYYSHLARPIHILDAGRAPQLSDDQRLQIRAELSAHADEDAGGSFMDVAELLHEYFPNHRIEYTDKEWEIMTKKLHTYRASFIQNYTALARVLRYSEDPRRPEITERDWDEMTAKLNRFRTDPKEKDIGGFTAMAMWMSDLDPSRAPILSVQDWEDMHQGLTNNSQIDNIASFMHLAAKMKRLSPNPQLVQTSDRLPPLPEVKNF